MGAFGSVVTLGAGSATIGALTANQSVNVAQINGVAATMGNGISGTGVQRVTLASDSTGQVTLAAGSNTIGALTANQSVNVAQINGVAATMGNGVSGTGVQRVTIASDSTGQAAPAASASATGADLFRNASLNNTATAVKASAGSLYSIQVQSTNAAVTFLQFWNTAAGSVVVGTTTPVKTVPIPGSGMVDIEWPVPLAFGTAITVAGTVNSDGTGGALGAGLLVNVDYK